MSRSGHVVHVISVTSLFHDNACNQLVRNLHSRLSHCVCRRLYRRRLIRRSLCQNDTGDSNARTRSLLERSAALGADQSSFGHDRSKQRALPAKHRHPVPRRSQQTSPSLVLRRHGQYSVVWGLEVENWSQEKELLTRYGDHGSLHLWLRTPYMFAYRRMSVWPYMHQCMPTHALMAVVC